MMIFFSDGWNFQRERWLKLKHLHFFKSCIVYKPSISIHVKYSIHISFSIISHVNVEQSTGCGYSLPVSGNGLPTTPEEVVNGKGIHMISIKSKLTKSHVICPDGIT